MIGNETFRDTCNRKRIQSAGLVRCPEGRNALWPSPCAEGMVRVPRAADAFGCGPAAITAGLGRFSGRGQERPILERDKTADVLLARKGSMPHAVPMAGGMQRGRISGPPCQDCGTTPHILQSFLCPFFPALPLPAPSSEPSRSSL
jgi:hypothetical protein